MREKIEKAIYDNVMVGNLAGNVSLHYVDRAAVKILAIFREEVSKLKPLSDKEMERIGQENPLLDMSFQDDYREEVKVLLQAQLDAVKKELEGK